MQKDIVDDLELYEYEHYVDILNDKIKDMEKK
jgi:hypothetical protein